MVRGRLGLRLGVRGVGLYFTMGNQSLPWLQSRLQLQLVVGFGGVANAYVDILAKDVDVLGSGLGLGLVLPLA